MVEQYAIWAHPKRKRQKRGYWRWYWPGGFFIITIEGKPPFRCYNDTPDFDGWVRQFAQKESAMNDDTNGGEYAG